MDVDVLTDLAEFDDSSWDALVPSGGYYSTHAWLSSHEALYPRKAAYLRVTDGAGLVAVAPVGYARREPAEHYSQDAFGQIFGTDATYSVLGARRAYRNPWLLRPGIDHGRAAEAVSLLVRTALEVAEQWGCDAVVVPYLSEPDLEPLASSKHVERVEQVDTEGVLAVPGSFAQYLTARSRKRRWSILHERDRPREMGMEFAVERARPIDEFASLMAQVENKYGRRATVDGLRRYLEATFASDTEHARVFTCRDPGGALVSAALGFAWRNGLYIRATATDYGARPTEAFAHFNVMYYEPIEYCARQGLSWIYFGVEALPAKRLRGCEERPLLHALVRR
ncbi:GNAT family N-acetyltransferase [Micromonospora sp. NPDC049900]|uniref:GNAT family N-acetyltransferase n=1 Tax=Micromonospora sp. NPDC049900 TaxID=3364275 RepID=UPI0037AA6554